VVTYRFVVTNTGNVTVSGASVAETAFSGTGALSALTCAPVAPAALAPSASMTCTATYALTQADVDAGTVTNTAVASGTVPNPADPANPAPVTSPPDTATVTIDSAPALALVKSVAGVEDTNGNKLTDAGDVVTYRFVVTNTGNVTVDQVAVAETAFSGTGALSALSCAPVAPVALAPTAAMTCTATYALSQADVDAGRVTNTAVATGTAPNPDDPSDPLTVTSPPSDAVVTAVAAPALALVKSVRGVEDTNGNALTDAGDVVTYQFVVTNTGNVTVHGVAVAETAFSGTGTLSALDCTPSAPATLVPSASLTCTATYALSQADVDAGSVTNTAVATGTIPNPDDPSNPVPVTSPPNSATQPIAGAPALGLAKTVKGVEDTNGSGTTDAGDVVTYQFVVTNTGNVTVDGVAVTETAFSGTGALSALDCSPSAPGTLAPTHSMTCTASYALSQADVDAGKVTNIAVASGTAPNPADPANPIPVTSPPSSAVVTNEGVPELSLVKSVKGVEDTNGNTVTDAGDVVTYQFVVTNTGNVTVEAVAVAESSFSGTGTLSALDCDPSAPATLAPKQALTCTATYALTQADVDAGKVSNVAVASGTVPNPADPSTPVVVTSPPSPVTEVIDAAPKLALAKSVTGVEDTNGNAVTDAGDVISYRFVVTNTGNVTVSGASVAETAFSGTGTLSALTCDPAAPATLAPSASMTCTATYALSQADVDAGTVTNTAVASGTVPNPADPANPAPVTSPPSSAVQPIAGAPALGLVKSVAGVEDTNGNGMTDAGDVVTYRFVVTNTGNVTVTGASVTETAFSGDPANLSALTCDPAAAATLAPTAAMTCTATYPLSQADLDAGKVTNTAVATATVPNPGDPANPGTVTSPPSEAELTPVAAPRLGLAKTVKGVEDRNGNAVTDAGDLVTYQFVVSNPGNVTITDAAVHETAFSGTGTVSALDCAPSAPATLAPGQSMTCTATYALTQADADAGTVTNTAVATGTAPNPDDPGHRIDVISPLSDAVVTGNGAPALGVAKTVRGVDDRNGNGRTDAGDVVTYQFVATNTGNLTVDGVGIREIAFSGSGPISAITCDPASPASLAPGASMTCAATYTLSQADVDAGGVTNTAVATGTVPNPADPSTPVAVTSPPATVTVGVPAEPALTLVKTVKGLADTNGNALADAGDVVTYQFVVANTGNVTVSDVTVNETAFSGTGTLSALTCDPGAPATLAPSGSMTCTATYVLTATDASVGIVTNTAIATGTAPGGDGVTTAVSSNNSTADLSTEEETQHLPYTGFSAIAWAGSGVALFAVGGLLLLAARRRRAD
jgi:uncharacterized repeat protein (TIGR01451 family)